MSPSGSTRVAAVIGNPIAHSLSPTIHNAAFAATGLDWVYVACEVAPDCGTSAIDAMRTLGISGLSVTMPHKNAVLGAVDELTNEARRLQAVNCVFWRNGVLVGDNTDGAGVLWALRHLANYAVAGQTVAVLGAGGAARATISALGSAGASRILIVNRTRERAVQAAGLASGRAEVVGESDLGEATLVINATPVGMAGVAEPIDTRVVPGPGCIAMDLIYHPAETRWLAVARANGAVCLNGVGMLVGQAAVAFEHWTGIEAPSEAMLAAAQDEISART